MATIDDKVRLANRLAQSIQNQGYEVTSPAGHKLKDNKIDSDGLGISGPIQLRGWTSIFKKSPEPRHRATLWIDNKQRGAKYKEHWVLEYYDTNDQGEMLNLSGKLSNLYDGVSIEIKTGYHS